MEVYYLLTCIARMLDFPGLEKLRIAAHYTIHVGVGAPTFFNRSSFRSVSSRFRMRYNWRESAFVAERRQGDRKAEEFVMDMEQSTEWKKLIEKQNRLIRFQSTVQSLILILLIGVTIFGVVFYFRVQDTMITVEAKLSEVDTESLNRSIAALDVASANLEGLDADAINEAVISLNEASNNLAAIDTEKMNEMTDSLNKSAENLETVSEALASIFG